MVRKTQVLSRLVGSSLSLLLREEWLHCSLNKPECQDRTMSINTSSRQTAAAGSHSQRGRIRFYGANQEG